MGKLWNGGGAQLDTYRRIFESVRSHGRWWPGHVLVEEAQGEVPQLHLTQLHEHASVAAHVGRRTAGARPRYVLDEDAAACLR